MAKFTGTGGSDPGEADIDLEDIEDAEIIDDEEPEPGDIIGLITARGRRELEETKKKEKSKPAKLAGARAVLKELGLDDEDIRQLVTDAAGASEAPAASSVASSTLTVPTTQAGNVMVIDEYGYEKEVAPTEYDNIKADVAVVMPNSDRVRLPNGQTLSSAEFRKHPKRHLGKGMISRMRRGATPTS